MQHELGDDYLRRLAAFIRTNERALAEAVFLRRRRAQLPPPSASVSVLNPLGWFGFDAAPSSQTPPPKPVVLSTDVHHLFYVLMRLEALGYDVGTLDVEVDSPSRPTSYVNLFPGQDKSETLSLASFRSSLSVVSGLSLGGGWWSKPEPPSVDAELKYILSSFTKLPALSIHAPEKKLIAELVDDPPHNNALPLEIFRNLQTLECLDVDPRMLLGWDKLAESLRSLKIKKSGLEDVSDILIGAVIDDQARREGSASRQRRRRIPRGPTTSFHQSQLPDTVVEEEDGEARAADMEDSGSSSPTPPSQLSSTKWSLLRHLALPDNSLTFFPSEPLPYLTSLTHLDLSSNLLVSVPPGLGTLHNLVSLNLSDNMIDSVLGIYQNLGQVLYINLSHNRLESICGLERLHALERVDLRSNLIEESAEVGRLAPLPNISEVWVEGNPLVEIEEGYRITCFDYFWKEGKTITLDGTQPGFYERRNLTVAPPEQMSSTRPMSTVAPSPPVVAVGHSHSHAAPGSSPALRSQQTPTPPSSNASPHLAPISAVGVAGKGRKKKVKRIVNLDGTQSEASSRSASHAREDSVKDHRRVPSKNDRSRQQPSQVDTGRKWGQIGTLATDADELTSRAQPSADTVTAKDTPSAATKPQTYPEVAKTSEPPRRSRHSRYQTEFLPSPTQELGNKFDAITSASNSSAAPSTTTFSRNQGSATFSSRSGARRARVSASVYEPAVTPDGEGNGAGSGDIRDNAEAYRRRIEALKQDMGDGWLKVFSQSQMKSPS